MKAYVNVRLELDLRNPTLDELKVLEKCGVQIALERSDFTDRLTDEMLDPSKFVDLKITRVVIMV